MHAVTAPKKVTKGFIIEVRPAAERVRFARSGGTFKDRRRKAKVNDRVSLKRDV
jgi:hypothetical protein